MGCDVLGCADHEILEYVREHSLALNFSGAEMGALTDRIADDLYRAMRACADRQFPRKPVALSMEVLGKQVLEIVLLKFYGRVS